jgi:two-component system OmpR family response regulator
MKLLIIEDEADTARYLCNGLREAGYDVTWIADPAEGKRMSTSEIWDLIILDRMLPDEIDGLSIIKHLRELGKTTPIVVLSALATLDERVKGLRGGGDDYLAKPFSFPELLARVEALLRRSGIRDNGSDLRIADLRLDLTSRRAERAGKPLLLQPREFRLLEYLVRHQGQIVTRSMLLEAVWDYHFDPQTNVIDVQISRLRNKIDKGFSPALLHTIRGVGYRMGTDE